MTAKTTLLLTYFIKRTSRSSLSLVIMSLTACNTTNTRSKVRDLELKNSQQSAENENGHIKRADITHTSLLRYFPAVKNPIISNRISKVADKIKKSIPPIRNCCRFYLIRMNTVNAFSLPNGNIYITVKFMSLLETEAQLAAVLSHEIAHIGAKHSVKDYNNKAMTYNVYKELHRRGKSSRLTDITQTLGRAYIKGYKREIESEADLLGLKYMALAGYHPEAMIHLFMKIKVQFAKSSQHQTYNKTVYVRDRGIFASYPRFDARIKNARQLIKNHIQHDIHRYPKGLIRGREIFSSVRREANRLIRRKSSTLKVVPITHVR